MPAVSVIVPVHNGAKHLPSCLRSIVEQTLTDLEILVIDDGSTDDSAKIVAEFAAADPRVSCLPGPGLGSAGEARNVGLDRATGDYLSFLDADDFFAPTMLAELHAKAVADDADIAICKFRVYDERTEDANPVSWPLRLEYFPEKTPFSPDAAGDALFLATNPAAWNKLFRTDFVRRTGLRFQGLRRTNDAFFTYSALSQANRLTYLDEYLLSYRTGNAASLRGSRDQQPLAWVDALVAIRTELGRVGLFEKFERAFTNLALDFCLANLRRPTSSEAYLTMHSALTDGVLAKLGILGHQTDYFLRAELRDQLADLLNLTPMEFLFTRLNLATDQLNAARAEVRANLRELDVLRQGEPATEVIAPAAAATKASAGADRVDVSVILRVRDAETLVAESLDSVLNQPGVKVEVICLDQHSADLSGRVLAQRSAEDARVRLITAGVDASASLNAAIAAATGRYLSFLEAGDRWQPGVLAGLVAHADAAELQLLGFDADTVADPEVDAATWRRENGHYRRTATAGGALPGPALLTQLHRAGHYRPQAWLLLADRELVAGLEPTFVIGAPSDMLFTVRLLLAASRAEHSPTALVLHRVGAKPPVTPSQREADARHYFSTCLELSRLGARVQLGRAEAATLGALIFEAYRNARANFIRINVDAGNRIAGLDSAPDAQALALLLKQAHQEAQYKRGAGGSRPGLYGRLKHKLRNALRR
ncbi:MAG: glycosyltransferase [Propionicimonas sp.]|uniref:glycosyltransferase n=1 Tax=Propionicimonas sp. TaxID=1955623 RepID=UPI001DCA7FFE|nr:glycosyltransferase [Propionicimonas sp.]MBU4188648.1 glycosyltransferase [Actinomycetota bacterium]MBU4251253.1 glycosyltransferase [Actinomycetota bacterium]MBU4415946.1 glycosyltransferase [Actinomycetota bacterium]MBU4587733.1 glycosyltransferase [Actinomycetota bacterium]MCG2805903.1 glycosyltransferase [Propionicimonas sp.]